MIPYLYQTILESKILNIENTIRFAGSYYQRAESTATHTALVGLISLTIANQLIQNNEKVDLGQVALKSLVHDIDEALMPDIPRPIKYSSHEMHSLFEKMAEDLVTKLHSYIPFTDLFKLWSTSKDDSVEGQIVAAADFVSVIIKCYDEIAMLGNQHFVPVLVECKQYLEPRAIHMEELGFNSLASIFRESERMADHILTKHS